jgi:endonuclease YncB( thermonuclease family)
MATNALLAISAFAGCLFIGAVTRAGDTYTGKVVDVVDGDTLTVLDGSKARHNIRLQGIDAPEKNQAFGEKARKFLSDTCFGKTVTVTVSTHDEDHHEMAEVILSDDNNLNQKIVAAGLAWWYREKAPNDNTLADLERQAKESKSGLWSGPKPLPPWERRKLDERNLEMQDEQVAKDAAADKTDHTDAKADEATAASAQPGTDAKTFTLYNPVTGERQAVSDPDSASLFVSKGWMLESTPDASKEGTSNTKPQPSMRK